MENRTFNFFVVILCLIPLTSTQQHARRKIQSETRIKLPSDIAFTHESNGDIEGEACYNLVRQTSGVCLLPNLCPEAIKDFQKGIQPQICNYKGHLPIICCPRSQKPVNTPNVQQSSVPIAIGPVTPSSTFISPITPSRIPSQPVLSSVGSQDGKTRISEQKCKQYMKLMVEETVVTTLSLNPENRTVQKTKCAKSSEGFIVGGTKTEHGEFPHMAVIGWQQEENGPIQWNCGGSLIRYE